MIVALDVETSCNDCAEFRVWREGFRVDSLALTWRLPDGALKSVYVDKSDEIRHVLEGLSKKQTPLVVHNLGFEMCVFMKLYPELQFNWAGDTMRLAQLLDNGGDWRDFKFETADDIMDRLLDETPVEIKSGLSLEAVASRFLPAERHNHKRIAHDWLAANEKITSDHGHYLHLLPPDILRQYNIADTEITLLLYEELTRQLTNTGFDWAPDWQLYTCRCKAMQEAYIRGIRIDTAKLEKEIYAVDAEILAITEEFFKQTLDARTQWADKFPAKRKLDRGRPEIFNIGSNKQLKELFIGILGIIGGHTTATGEKKVDAKELTMEEAARLYPSFASKHLKTWGPLGVLLLKRRKRLLVLQQMLGVFMGAQEDSRIHPEVRVSGTKTNRVSGGQGIA